MKILGGIFRGVNARCWSNEPYSLFYRIIGRMCAYNLRRGIIFSFITAHEIATMANRDSSFIFLRNIVSRIARLYYARTSSGDLLSRSFLLSRRLLFVFVPLPERLISPITRPKYAIYLLKFAPAQQFINFAESYIAPRSFRWNARRGKFLFLFFSDSVYFPYQWRAIKEFAGLRILYLLSHPHSSD